VVDTSVQSTADDTRQGAHASLGYPIIHERRQTRLVQAAARVRLHVIDLEVVFVYESHHVRIAIENGLYQGV
jgi:hypothetical protein